MADLAFLGMRATNDFTVTGQRPQNWRETIMRLYPNGKAPLTALLSLMKNEKTDDPEYHWYCKVLPEQAATPTGIWTDAALSIPATGPATTGAVVYIQMSEVEARQFMPSHTILFRNINDPSYDTMAIVELVILAGASSYIRVRLLENAAVSISAADIQRILIVGSANAEGAMIGQAIAYDPYEVHNYTQIFRNALEITRTADLTRLRTGDAYKEAKRDALELHSIEMEKAFLFGVPSQNIGPNGKPLRTTGGLIWSIKNYGGLVDTFPVALNWLNDGLEWIEERLMQVFRYGDTEKMAFIGDGALLAINRIAREKGTWNYTPSTTNFGMRITELTTPFGHLILKTHPLFSHEPTNRYSMLVFEPRNIRYRYITDTVFYRDDKQHGHNRYDAKKEEYLTEAGLEFHFPQCWAWMNGIGVGAGTFRGGRDGIPPCNKPNNGTQKEGLCVLHEGKLQCEPYSNKNEPKIHKPL